MLERGHVEHNHNSRLIVEARKAIRDACLGLTQIEVQRLTGVTPSGISRLVNGNRIPTLETIEKILDGLGYEVELRIRKKQ